MQACPATLDWCVKGSEDSICLFAAKASSAVGEELSADEIHRCALLAHAGRLQRGAAGSLPNVYLPVSGKHFSQWRGYVSTARVVPAREMSQFEAALCLSTVSAVFQARLCHIACKAFWKYEPGFRAIACSAVT